MNESLDINYYETVFRNYDVQIVRFTGIDILAEQQLSLTPYHYGNNDPIYFNDPLGDRYKAPTAYGNSVDEISNIALSNQGISPLLGMGGGQYTIGGGSGASSAPGGFTFSGAAARGVLKLFCEHIIIPMMMGIGLLVWVRRIVL